MAHKANISEMAGIGRKLPITMVAFSIGVLGMIGAPPAGGFATKWYLALGSMEAGSTVILLVLLVSTVLNAAYFLPVVYTAFFRSPDDAHHGSSLDPHEDKPPIDTFEGRHGDALHHGGHHEDIKENPFIAVPLVVSALGSLVLGFYPDMLLGFVKGIL